MRIVSLLPSATESLALIGAKGDIVGRSHECDHPAGLSGVPVLTSANTEFTDSAQVDRDVSDALSKGQSLYRLDTEKLRTLKPDLIVTQDLCEVCSIDLETVRGVAKTLDPVPTVVSLNPQSFEAVLDDVITLGEATGRMKEADDALFALRDRFFTAADYVNPYDHHPSVLFLKWTDPPFVGGHWTPQLIERAGGAHPLNPTEPMADAGAGAGAQWAHRMAGKSTRVTHEAIVRSMPEYVVVCPCGLKLEQAIAETKQLESQDWWNALPAVNSGNVSVVDGNQMFNRPGPRLVDAYEWLVGYLNDLPDRIPEGFPWTKLPQTTRKS